MHNRTWSEWVTLLEQQPPRWPPQPLTTLKKFINDHALNPVAPLRVTVAGTNGKGSTCRALEVLALKQGLRVGLYSSPHLCVHAERVRLQGCSVETSWLCDAMHQLWDPRWSFTFFEWMTLAALWIFKKNVLDLVILEVGLGGRLDAVNAIEPTHVIITTIDYDHMHHLGDTLEAIAQEKAAVMRPGIPVVIAEPTPPMSLITEAERLKVKRLQAGKAWTVVRGAQTWSYTHGALHLEAMPLPPVAVRCVACAVTLAHLLGWRLDQLICSMPLMQLPGRFQQLRPTLFVDVAHNPQSMRYVASRIAAMKKKHVHLICSMLKDKAIGASLEAFGGLNLTWYSAPLPGPRSADLQQLREVFPEKTRFFPSVGEALEAAVQAAGEEIVVGCGSFLTVAAILEAYGLAAEPPRVT